MSLGSGKTHLGVRPLKLPIRTSLAKVDGHSNQLELGVGHPATSPRINMSGPITSPDPKVALAIPRKMSVGAVAALETFDALNLGYERAYGRNEHKAACVRAALEMLKPGARVLDVGCGTGVPVAMMLAAAGLDVTGIDISPRMVALAASRVPGRFLVADMATYVPPSVPLDHPGLMAVFVLFSHLQLPYADVHAACYRFAAHLEPNGLLVIGQTPSDTYVEAAARAERPVYDAEGRAGRERLQAYVEDFPVPFMGEMLPTFMMSAEGQREFVSSMGLEIVSETLVTFQPDDPRCEPEQQQYIIGRRIDEEPIRLPQPMPIPWDPL